MVCVGGDQDDELLLCGVCDCEIPAGVEPVRLPLHKDRNVVRGNHADMCIGDALKRWRSGMRCQAH